jgi:4-hydroxy-3-polyprenylbenzoate decarboxylase
MYRIQLNGNEYQKDTEIGLHYQLHRGIGIHQTNANKKGQPLKVSVFVGGPPAHTVSAVMPLPEGMSELSFAGVLGGRRFRYAYKDGFCISTDADFVITGEVYPEENKPEGPFGDHLGYYSLKHDFPLMRVHKVYARKNAIWPFTVVGRPPQEDTSFGDLIHEITGDAIQHEVPGLKELNAVDAAGVHPLLIAIGSERYTPFMPTKQPAELLTIANRMLGTGQLSLAKFLFITADEQNKLNTKDIQRYFEFVLERVHWDRDVHFYTKTTIDTLDYSGESLNIGSKVVIAAYGEIIRKLAVEIPAQFQSLQEAYKCKIAMPGVISIEMGGYKNNQQIESELAILNSKLSIPNSSSDGSEIALIVLSDDADFVSTSLNNFLWVTFTRCNPSHDIHGINAFIENKHWGCKGPLIIDARIKPHHAPPVVMDSKVEANIEKHFKKGGALYQIEK